MALSDRIDDELRELEVNRLLEVDFIELELLALDDEPIMLELDEILEAELIAELLEDALIELEKELVAAELLLDLAWLDGALESGVEDRGCSATVSFLSPEAPQADRQRVNAIRKLCVYCISSPWI
jgi:hypothetical protein